MRFLEPEESTTSQFSSPANDSLNTAVEPAGNSGQTQARGGFGLTNFADIQSMSDANKVQQGSPDKPKMSRRAKTAIVLTVLALLAVGGVVFGAWQLYRRGQQAQEKTSTTDKYNQQSIALDGQNQETSISPNILSGNQQVDVNGSLQVAGSLRLVPTSRPANPIPGQQYIDATDNKLYLFNGSDWIAQLNVIDLNAVNATIENLTVQNASIANQVTANSEAIDGTSVPVNTTLQGNSFNGAGQLLQLSGSGQVADNLLTSNVALLDRSSQKFTGSNIFQNTTDSTVALQVQNAAGTSNLLVADTQNTRLGVGLANPGYTLDVGGDVNLAVSGALRIGGTQICTSLGCVASGGSGSYIQNDTGLQSSANFNIQSASDITPATQIRARALQTANLSEWQDAAGIAVASISPSGAVAAASFAASGSGFSGSGTGLTSLNAANISTGILSDARLSNNVALLDATQIFTGTSNTFSGTINANTITPTSAMAIGDTDYALTLQGNGSTILQVLSSVVNPNIVTVGFSAALTTNRNIRYEFQRNVGSSSTPVTYTICTTSGNCMGGSGGGANTALSNLLSPTAINQHLLPGVAGAVNLGSNALPFGTISFAGTADTPASKNFTLTGNPSAQHTISMPDGSGEVCVRQLENCLASGGGGGGASATLNNLSNVAINTSLLSGGTNDIDLGSNTHKFKDLWLGGVIQGGAASQWIATSGADSTTVSFAAPSGNNTIVVPAASGTMAVSATGNIALSGAGQISFTGTLPVANGGTGAASLIQNGVLYGNGTSAVGATAAGTTGQCLIGQTGAAPVFGNCASSGSGVTLQAAYDNGNTIATTDARNLTVTLANTTTDPNFLVNIASGSTGKFAIQDNSSIDLLRVTTVGGVLANADVTLNRRSDTSASTYTQYQATASTGYPNIFTGTYQGNGGATKTIDLPPGWGEPQLVIIQPHSSSASAYRLSGMPTGEAKPLGSGGAGLETGYINSMTSNSFEVAQAHGNVNGRIYSYTVVRAESGTIDNYFSVGMYTGSGTNDRTVCINGGSIPTCSGAYTWTPNFVMVAKDGSAPGMVPFLRTSEMDSHVPSDWSVGTAGSDGSGRSDYIQAFGSGSFQVGGNNIINHLGQSYYYFAFREIPGYVDVGKYTGDGGSSYSFTDPGFQPDFALTRTDYFNYGCCGIDYWQGVFKGVGMGLYSNSAFTGWEDSLITSLDSTGFTTGDSPKTNDNGLEYYTFALKSFSSTSTVNGYSAGAVYNGKFYTATKRSNTTEIYRYDGGTTYTRVSSGTAGRIRDNDADTVINSIPTMKVYDGKLFVGTDTGAAGKAAIYYCSNGSGNCNVNTDWTPVNTTPGTLDGGTTGINSINSMSIVNGVLYVATAEPSGAEIYRYNGGTGAAVFTKISGTAGDINSINGTTVIDGFTLLNYNGQLYAGSQTGSDGKAGIYASSGETNWSAVNSTRGTFASTANIDDVTAMAVYNGSLVLGTGDSTANLAEIYRYNAPQGGATSGSNLFSKISDTTAGRIDSTGSARVDAIGSLTIYNGVLLAGSNNNSADANTAIYKFDGMNSWSKLGSQAEGTLGITSGVDGILFMTQYNDTLFTGSNKSAAGFIYTIAENSSMSYALKFAGTSDGAFDNIGSIAFMSADQSGANFNNHGQFLLSHTLTTSAGAYDIAEDYQTRDDELVPGDVAAIDPGNESGFVRRANLTRGDGLRLLGVVSTHPAFRLSQKENFNPAAGSRTVPIALAGRVPVRIDPDSEPVAPGDYLAASAKPGMAIKSAQSGNVIGKALEGWSRGGKPTVEIFVSNTFLLPGGQALSTQNTTDQIIAAGKPVTIFDAFLATTDNTLQALKNFTVFGKAVFNSETEFKGRLTYHDRDMAGHAVIYKGQQEIRVKFDQPYEDTPVISVTPLNFIRFKVIEKSKDGFTIRVEDEVQEKVEFDWGTINIINPKTFDVTPAPVTN